MPITSDIYYFSSSKNVEGGKPPVVLIHGAGGTHLHWPPVIRRLPGYRVFALDLPGHGKSLGRGQQSIEAYSSSVITWMEAAGIPGAVFVGHSMGSAIAISLALDFHEHVLGICLIGSGTRLKVSQIILDNTSNTTTFDTAVATIVSWSFSPKSSQELIALAAQRMADTRPSVLHGDLLACNAFDRTAQIGNIYQPAMVICGEDDRMTPPRYSKYLSDSIPGSKLEIIPNAGHMVMLEQSQVVASLLEQFLARFKYL